jgi:hypothetical protein
VSLDRLHTIDAIGTERETGVIVLTIIDGWDWSDAKEHLDALQSKINTYFEFVESGQFLEEYPAAAGALLRIDLVSRVELPQAARALIEAADRLGASLGIRVVSAESD